MCNLRRSTLLALLVLGGLLLLAPQPPLAIATADLCPLCHNEVTVRYQEDDDDGPPPSTADHSQYDILQQDFADATEVTAACLSCHNQADGQLHRSIHWTWEFTHPETNQLLGKRHVINNHVLAITENQEYCATCHNGYGFDGPEFDFTAAENIDCLSCHDTTGDYAKLPGAAGHPAYEATEYPPGSGNTWPAVDLNRIAQNVGPSSRQSCGSCHFNEQSVNPFIHGRIPAAMAQPSPELDVHMGTDFLDFSCSSCHEPQNHQFFSSKYQPVSETDMADSHLVHATCVSCHTPEIVHDNPVLTRHTERIACQSCHIPNYAREEPELVGWDWSQAGRSENGEPVVERNAEGLLTYHGHYGALEWAEQITPRYAWFNGTISYTRPGDEIDPSQLVEIKQLQGDYADGESRLWPLRVQRGVQPFDPQSRTLVPVNLYGDEAAFWQAMDWAPAIRTAMEAAGLGFSGEYDFVETEMVWPLNHGVAPAEDAVRCSSCHSRDGILAGLDGAYVPGRDYQPWLDWIGRILLAGAVLAVLGHSTARGIAYRRRKSEHQEDER